nr:zinc finger, CCHC-type, retrotransposon Gag domain protein [Tanacetum cinerariifolium]
LFTRGLNALTSRSLTPLRRRQFLIDAENWISHMEKIFDVIGCEDPFRTRLAVYKFEGNALAWWKAYKQAKGGDAWLVTVAWADFKKLFFLQFSLERSKSA